MSSSPASGVYKQVRATHNLNTFSTSTSHQSPYPTTMFKSSVLNRTTRACASAAPLRSRLVHTTGAVAAARTQVVSSASAPARSLSTTSASLAAHAPSEHAFVSRARANNLPPTEPWRRHMSQDPSTPNVFTFFEKATSTWQYVVADPQSSEAVIIDPVLDYDPASGAVTTKTADGLVSFVEHNGLKVVKIL